MLINQPWLPLRVLCCLAAASVAFYAVNSKAQSPSTPNAAKDKQSMIPGLSLPLSERVAFQPGPYPPPPEAARGEGVPAGTITEHRFNSSTIFPGTNREYWLYVPAQYDSTKPAALMVFQDGHAYLQGFKTPEILDNLIHEGAIPTTIAVFIEPGHVGNELPEKHWDKRNNRGLEYNVPDDAYARFLIDEFLPTALANYNISDNPTWRMVGGSSSGGICAFNTAWQRPDSFGKVFSAIGSFTNIRGGHDLEAQVRKPDKPRMPLRIFMQDGVKDLNNTHGHWYLGNQTLAASLEYARHDYRFVVGTEGHNQKHGAAVLPDALRWLYHDWGHTPRQIVMPSKPSKDQLPKGIPGVSIELNEHVLFDPGPYTQGPDSRPKPGVPQGAIHEHTWTTSTVYPGTERSYWVYIPKQYDGTQPAALMVFQDGKNMMNPKRFSAPAVLDTLIAEGSMPVTIGILINPGNNPKANKKSGNSRHNNRSEEYDRPTGTYAEFLLTEIIPDAIKQHNLNISTNPKMRGISGSSSGGICAFKCAWHRPDQFGKVVSFNGSFTNIRGGGHHYQAWVRKTDKKDIRVFLQDGIHDLDGPAGHWFLSNQTLAKSLAFKDYDHRFVIGTEGHNANHPSSLLPEALRWVWRD